MRYFTHSAKEIDAGILLALQLSRSFAGAQDDKKSAQDDKQKRSGWQMQALRMTNPGAKNDTQSYKTILPAL